MAIQALASEEESPQAKEDDQREYLPSVPILNMPKL